MKRDMGGRLFSIGMAIGLMATHARATAFEFPTPQAAEIRNDALILTIAGTPHQTNPFAAGRSKQMEISCLSNAKQVATAFQMYLQDYKGVFPKGPAYMPALLPYTKNPALFRCPLDPNGTVSYTLNSNVAGVAITSIPIPANTVLFYEGTGGKLKFRHNGWAVVGFVDGHCSLVDQGKAALLLWKAQIPKTGTPTRKKHAGK